MEKLTPEERSAIAKKAVQAREAKRRSQTEKDKKKSKET
jgi:TRAP-type C4-dicarboxylate transport system substrate-binding protein